jgi:hypothetical protein
MQYMLLIYEDETVYGSDKSGPAMQEIVAKHKDFNVELGSARVGGAGLKATGMATTIRTAGGAKTIHDGPFAETREQLGGYYLIDVPDLDAALSWAGKCPGVGHGIVEVRAIWPMGPANSEQNAAEAAVAAAR